MKLSYFTCILTLFLFACNAPDSDAVKNHDKEAFVGSYLIKLNPKEIELDSNDMAAKFLLSIMEPLKITANFKENGFVKFSGAYGLMNFGNKMDTDSVPFKVVGNKLFIEEMDINSQDFFEYEIMEDHSISLIADSIKIILVPNK